MNTEAVPRLSPGAVARPPRPGVGWLQRGPCPSLCSPPPPPMPPQELYCSPLPYSFQTGDSSTSPLSTNFMASRYILTSLFTY